MITFEKINETYTDIFYNGLKIGRVEVYKFSKYYTLEIDYRRYRIEFKDKQRIPSLIESCVRSRKTVQEYLDKHKKAWLNFKPKDRSKCKILE